MVRVSLKHGINSSSCEAFSLYGSILCAYGKLQEGRRMSKIVDLILARHDIDDRAIRSRSISYVGFINHWTAPLQEFISPLLEGYQLGLRCGDNISAAHSLCCRMIMLYCMGRPLADVYQEIKTNIDAITKLNVTEHLLVSQAYLEAVETLTGFNDDDCSSCHINICPPTPSECLDSFQIIARLEVSVFLANLDDATDLLLEAGDLSPQLGGLITKAQFIFLEAFISIQAARTEATWKKKRKWKRRAMKSVKIIRGWVKKGNVNLVHRLHLLEAELAALEGKNAKAISNYKSAITVACENGFIQDVGLSHEYASSFFGSIGDEDNEEYHMEQCKEYYSQWGATAKIEKLTND